MKALICILVYLCLCFSNVMQPSDLITIHVYSKRPLGSAFMGQVVIPYRTVMYREYPFRSTYDLQKRAGGASENISGTIELEISCSFRIVWIL